MQVTYNGPNTDGETIIADGLEIHAKPGETVTVPDAIAVTLSPHWTREE